MNNMISKTVIRAFIRKNLSTAAATSSTATPISCLPPTAAVNCTTRSTRTLFRNFSISSFPSRTVPLYDKISIKVPSMGDSISEGTVVEWVAEVGQAVKADDVIALIETDKVTIDIKAQIDGVIVKHFAGIEEEVEVGADLYEIDTDAQATAPEGIKASPDDTDATSVHQEEDAPAVTAVDNGNETDSDTNIDSETDSNSDEKVRVPSIQFLGKKGWMSKRSVQGSAAPVLDPVPSIPMKPHGAITLQNGDLPSSYGRLPFSEREIEDLTLGGAAEAPYETYVN